MDAKILFQLNEAYRQGVCSQIEEEVLSEEELLDIQEWVEALIDEGYDLDEYTDEELYEAYLDEVRGGGRIDPVSGFPKHGEKVSRTPKEAGLLMSPLDRAKARENAFRKRGKTKQANQIQSRFIRPTERGLNRSIHASNVARSDEKKRLMSQNEEFDLYDLVSEYLVSEGFCDSYEDADVIMVNMSEEWRDEIIDEAVRGSQRSIGNIISGNDIRQVTRGGRTIYKKPKWQDQTETEVRRDMGRERHKNPYQYGSELTKQAKASAKNMNAIKNIETVHDDNGDIETIDHNSRSGYRTVPTDYRARRRRASGR